MENGNKQNSWHWQEPNSAWRGIGIYHITLTVPSREPILGMLIIPENNPAQARIERSKLGNSIVEELLHIPTFLSRDTNPAILSNARPSACNLICYSADGEKHKNGCARLLARCKKAWS